MTLRAEHVSDLGDGVTRIAVPTPFAVGRVNCYLIDDDPLTLVDSGPNSGTSLVELEAGIERAGRRAADLERIVLTHQHLDHIGLAQILADRSGAEIVCLDALAPWLADFSASMDGDDRFSVGIMSRHGVPSELVLGLRAVTAGVRAWGAAATAGATVGDGDELEFAGRRWRAHHRPGHSPSDTVFHDEQRGVLFAGDHLLSDISSNPLVSRPLGAEADPERIPRPPALLIYMESLRRTRALDIAISHGGHGPPVGDHRTLIDQRLAGHDRRAAKIHRLLSERDAATAFELAQAMWGAVAVTQAYLTLSEVLGHVDMLEHDGRVRSEDDGRTVRFIAL